MAISNKLTKGKKLTKENFTSPPKEMGILPFWFWNGEMNEDEMEWQMKEYHNKGNAKVNLGDYRGAIQDYSKAIELNPNNANAYYNRGNAKSALGDDLPTYNRSIS